MSITFVDIILLILLLGLLYIGFASGTLKVLAIILGMYGGLQVAALFYTIFGSLTANQSDSASVITNQIIWFFALWIIWSIIFSLVAWSFLGTITLPKWLRNVDQLGGLVLGVFAAVFAMLIFGFVFKNTITMIWYGSGAPNNWLLTVKNAFDNSLLMSIFKSVKVLYVNILSPWLPGNNLPVFRDDPLGRST